MCIRDRTLFYQEEIAPLPKDILHPKISKAELNMAEKLIQSMTAPYEPQQYHDEFQEKLRAAIEAKINGSQIVQASNAKADNETPIDLMEALQQSIASMAVSYTHLNKAEALFFSL